MDIEKIKDVTALRLGWSNWEYVENHEPNKDKILECLIEVAHAAGVREGSKQLTIGKLRDEIARSYGAEDYSWLRTDYYKKKIAEEAEIEYANRSDKTETYYNTLMEIANYKVAGFEAVNSWKLDLLELKNKAREALGL